MEYWSHQHRQNYSSYKSIQPPETIISKFPVFSPEYLCWITSVKNYKELLWHVQRRRQISQQKINQQVRRQGDTTNQYHRVLNTKDGRSTIFLGSLLTSPGINPCTITSSFSKSLKSLNSNRNKNHNPPADRLQQYDLTELPKMSEP